MALRADHYPNNDPRAARPGDRSWPRTTGAPVPEYRLPCHHRSLAAVLSRTSHGTGVTVRIHGSTVSGSAARHCPATATERISGRSGRSLPTAIRNSSRNRFPGCPRVARGSAGNAVPVSIAATRIDYRYNRKSRYPKTVRLPSRPVRTKWCDGVPTGWPDVFTLPANTARALVRTSAERRSGRWSPAKGPTGAVAEYAGRYRSRVPATLTDGRSGPMSPICPQGQPHARDRAPGGAAGMSIELECTHWPDARVHIGTRHISGRRSGHKTRNRIPFGFRPPRWATLPYGTFRSRRDPVPTDTSVRQRGVVLVPAAVVPATAVGTNVPAVPPSSSSGCCREYSR
jgi:hypothetical protein